MINRSICVFPQFDNIEKINEVRKKYDSLHDLILPHISLVFPFTSSIVKEDLMKHIKEAVTDVSPFELTLKGITGNNNQYLFLNVKKGNDELIELHDRLYTGILKDFLNRNVSYVPHMTVGRINKKEQFEKVIDETKDFNYIFNTRISELTVEIIEEDEGSKIEFKIELM
ncbi:2'-5' RNA ligase family protein [Gottfriedia solisilvae]|uniref:2'-5' RNA ligase n=1 Tax=Gottfriedia solisilvae TaxID=1516104 RepID=A0A8J3AEX1_9BACI|nr:2'-5' RNA ligase family protein [Gottfriedia solisilvae]GGI11574.1 hypothetical protein GCM10007380_08520 [Gottfriedia solisilvae]